MTFRTTFRRPLLMTRDEMKTARVSVEKGAPESGHTAALILQVQHSTAIVDSTPDVAHGRQPPGLCAANPRRARFELKISTRLRVSTANTERKWFRGGIMCCAVLSCCSVPFDCQLRQGCAAVGYSARVTRQAVPLKLNIEYAGKVWRMSTNCLAIWWYGFVIILAMTDACYAKKYK